MTDDEKLVDELYRGLSSLAPEAFPKRCASCGKIFQTAEEFLRETAPVRNGVSGLKAADDEQGRSAVELYRNCSCGSTLLEFFGDRRGMTENGLQRREKVGKLIESLVSAGVDREIVRTKIISSLQGGQINLLALIKAARERQEKGG